MPSTGIIRVRLRKCVRSRRLWQPNPCKRHRQARNRGSTRCSAQESGGMGDAISQGEKGFAMPGHTNARELAQAAAKPGACAARMLARPCAMHAPARSVGWWSGGTGATTSCTMNPIPPPVLIQRGKTATTAVAEYIRARPWTAPLVKEDVSLNHGVCGGRRRTCMMGEVRCA